MESPASAACPTCASPRLTRRRVHVHGGLGVCLGYALLLPSLLVAALASMGVVAVGPGASRAALDAARREAAALEDADVPQDVRAEVAARRPLSPETLAALSSEQRVAVFGAQSSAAAGSARLSIARFGSGRPFALALGAAAASGLAGVLLLRKRAESLCAECGARA